MQEVLEQPRGIACMRLSIFLCRYLYGRLTARQSGPSICHGYPRMSSNSRVVTLYFLLGPSSTSFRPRQIIGIIMITVCIDLLRLLNVHNYEKNL